MAKGWCRRDADHLVVVELALSLAPGYDDDDLRWLVEQVEIALDWTPVFLGALYDYAQSEHATTWRRMQRLATRPGTRQRLGTLATHSEGFDTMTVDSEEALAGLITPEDITSLNAARLAESRGEFAKALELLQTVPMRTDDEWVDSLHQIVETDLEDNPLMWGRFICGAALRSALHMSRNRETLEHFGALVLLVAEAAAVEIRDDAELTAVKHPLVHDALLFDAGGLAVYLEYTLTRQVADRCPGIEFWAEAVSRVLRIEENLGGGVIRCLDLVTRGTVTVRAEGLADREPVGTCLLARVVQIEGDQNNYFATQPFGLDAVSATRIAAVIKHGGSVEDRLTEILRGLPNETPDSELSDAN